MPKDSTPSTGGKVTTKVSQADPSIIRAKLSAGRSLTDAEMAAIGLQRPTPAKPAVQPTAQPTAEEIAALVAKAEADNKAALQNAANAAAETADSANQAATKAAADLAKAAADAAAADKAAKDAAAKAEAEDNARRALQLEAEAKRKADAAAAAKAELERLQAEKDKADKDAADAAAEAKRLADEAAKAEEERKAKEAADAQAAADAKKAAEEKAAADAKAKAEADLKAQEEADAAAAAKAKAEADAKAEAEADAAAKAAAKKAAEAAAANKVRPKGVPAAYIYDVATDTWVKPPKPTGQGPTVWDDEKGWIAPTRPIGTSPAYTYDEATNSWIMPPKPEGDNWVWDNLKGWVTSTLIPGSGGKTSDSGVTLAKDTFKNTLALFFGAKEMSQPWVDALYNSVSSFYKTGSTIQEALNLSLQDIRNNPALEPFTKRFNGLYALQDRLAAGEAISVPTIAEYFKSESDLGDILRGAGLGDIATQEFLGTVLGTGKSVAETSNIISDVFNTIDNAPQALKDTLSQYFPGVDRVSLAKALLMGPQGAAELSKKVKSVSVLSAAETQGLKVDMATAADIAAMGYNYGQALTGFGQVAQELPTYQKLQEIESGQGVKTAAVQGQLQQSVFNKDIQERLAVEAAAQREANRFKGQAGIIGSRALASQTRGMI